LIDSFTVSSKLGFLEPVELLSSKNAVPLFLLHFVTTPFFLAF